jgi:hypothetical protein
MGKPYVVTVRRVLTQEFRIEVEALSAKEARRAACEAALQERPALWHGAKAKATAIKAQRGCFDS